MTTTDVILELESREALGKQNAKRIRREGKVPGVFYAHGEKPIPVVADYRQLENAISASGLIDVKIDNKRKRKAIIKDMQFEPLTNKFWHVDIMGVHLKEKITVTVPVHVVGEAVGVKDMGGMLHQYFHEIEVTCLPLDIPESIEIDVSSLEIGDAINIGDVEIENVTIEGDPSQPLVTVVAPAVAAAKEKEEEEEEVEEEEEETEEKTE